MDMTPEELAKQLGLTGRTIRGYLREQYRPNGEDKYSRWKLDEEMVSNVVQHFGKRDQRDGGRGGAE